MRKFFIWALALSAVIILAPVTGCSKKMDYSRYISERRTDIFLYADDSREIKIYCSEREQPYAADGCRGEMCAVTEIFISFSQNPREVSVSLGENSGEMSFRSLENDFYLSFSANPPSNGKADITLTADGDSFELCALSVKNDGVMDCASALACVTESNTELFEGMTKNNIFCGEIFVRLLYDENCYYYVGVCDRTGKITAWLLDGERGKIIASKTIQS